MVKQTQLLLATISRNAAYRWGLRRYRNARPAPIPSAKIDEYREDVRLITSGQLADVVVASAGFTLPEGLDKSESPTLFVTGAKEAPAARRLAATLARQMPNGVERVAAGMVHDWPLRDPDLFSRTVDGWLTDSALPPRSHRRTRVTADSRGTQRCIRNVNQASLFAPQHATAVDVHDLRGYRMLRAIVGDSLFASRHRLVVVDDAKTAGR